MTPHSIKGFPFLGHLSRNWQRREGGRLYARARSALSRQGQHYYKALLLNAITPPPLHQDPHPHRWIWSVIVLKPWLVFLHASGVFSCRLRAEQKESFSPAPFKVWTWDVFNSHFQITHGLLFRWWYYCNTVTITITSQKHCDRLIMLHIILKCINNKVINKLKQANILHC